MSGIFGCYFFKDVQKDLNPLADAMRQPLLVHQDCNSDTRMIGHRLFIGVTRTNCEASPYISKPDDNGMITLFNGVLYLSLIHISEPTRQLASSRMPSSA